ncbi:LysR family transcriptional regulator [Gibbsiella quercinecans]|uniref:HTH lysR-type domain-containing protein n=1 Tax=Gibbsiella quercinecans TaxID=929813 RepID=A0A250AWA5_9GAMM|nr:LysR family transcriptional regulator [Gibbsiella quercinecans]ATA18199.1 hypothetical protein AWC35_01870 [Gibbsiella quercinecans]RLM06768.1 hypothetical protein BIY30_15895 [Gibbsiella quercinecans]RLM12924.1 hypothetical protein BIY31_00670 [Gibbsiella quercinecans]TCT92539.1 LysR family transcriptional regulator [Gibbsiella quercinecans]
MAARHSDIQAGAAGISLGKLRSFVAVAEEGQFSQAARRLGVAQPSLSSQIRELEKLLGVVLFNRTTRSLALTAEGERFLQRARQLLRDLNSAVADLRNLAELNHGRIVVAATPSLSSALLPQAIQDFRQRFPDIVVQVREGLFSDVEDMVMNGIADIGVGPRPERHRSLVFNPQIMEQFVALVPPEHPLTAQQPVTLEALAVWPMIALATGAGIRSVMENTFQDKGLFPEIHHVLTRQDSVIAMVEANLGIAWLPALVALSGRPRRVRILQVEQPGNNRELGFIQRPGGSPSVAATAFGEHCFSEAVLTAAWAANDTEKMIKRALLACIFSRPISS